MCHLVQTSPGLSLQVRKLRSEITQDRTLHTLNPRPDLHPHPTPGQAKKQGGRAYTRSGILTPWPPREGWPPTWCHQQSDPCGPWIIRSSLFTGDTGNPHLGRGWALHSIFQCWLTLKQMHLRPVPTHRPQLEVFPGMAVSFPFSTSSLLVAPADHS